MSSAAEAPKPGPLRKILSIAVVMITVGGVGALVWPGFVRKEKPEENTSDYAIASARVSTHADVAQFDIDDNFEWEEDDEEDPMSL
jgi:hypothetical protein